MLWNPTSRETEGPLRQYRGGGKHLIYVFRNNAVEDEVITPDDFTVTNPLDPLNNLDFNDVENRMPKYDAGKWMEEKLRDVRGYLSQFNPEHVDLHNQATHVFRAGMWVMNPLLVEDQELLATDVTIRLRVNQEYKAFGIGSPVVNNKVEVGKDYYVTAGPIRLIKEGTLNDTVPDTTMYYRGMTYSPRSKEDLDFTFEYKNGDLGSDVNGLFVEQENGGLPLYEFSTKGMEPTFNNADVAKDALENIKAVPNPYYAYSKYETGKLDNRMIITNLPKTVTVRIYTINGTLVRTLEKDDDTITFLEWNLKNQSRVPIASGMYIIHVDAPDIGETVLKWMAVMRPIDLDNF